MKQCPTCGAEVQSEWTLCPACMSKLPSLITSPTVVQQPPGPVTFDAAAEVPEAPPSESQVSSDPPDVPAPGPIPIETPPAGKPPKKRDLVSTLTHPVLLGLVGALVIFLVLGLMLPGGLSDLFGGGSVNTRPVTPISTVTPPIFAATNTVIPLTPVNTTVNVTAAPPQTTPTAIPSVKPVQTVTLNQTYNPGHTLSPYLQNGGGGDGTWRYEPTSVGTLTYVQTAAPIVTWTTPPTFPIMPTPTLQLTVPTVPVVYPVVIAATTTQAVMGGHPTGSLAWAGTGNYASDFFDLSPGVAKISVTANLASVVTVMDSTGKTIGSTTAGPQPGSNAIPIPAAGRYLVDVSSSGTWTVTVGVISSGTLAPVSSGAGSVSITALDLIGETVTIKNSGSSSVNMAGWKLTDEGALHSYVFAGTTLPTGGSLTISSGPSSGDLKWSDQNVWNNEGDTAYLYDGSGQLVSQKKG